MLGLSWLVPLLYTLPSLLSTDAFSVPFSLLCKMLVTLHLGIFFRPVYVTARTRRCRVRYTIIHQEGEGDKIRIFPQQRPTKKLKSNSRLGGIGTPSIAARREKARPGSHFTGGVFGWRSRGGKCSGDCSKTFS